MSSFEKYVPIVGYPDAKVEQTYDSIDLTVTDMVIGAEPTVVTLFTDEIDGLIDALLEAKRLALNEVSREEEEFQRDQEEYSLRAGSFESPPYADVAPGRPIPVEPGDNVENIVQSYIDTEIPFVIDYTKMDGEEVTRTVSPYELVSYPDGTQFTQPSYVRGWDHDRDDIRTFRITRIDAIGPSREDYIQAVTA